MSKTKKEDLKKQSGTIPSPYDERDFPFSVLPTVKRGEIPDEFSLRSEQTSVKHQGEVGSCCSFAACGINEVLHKGNNPNLSERHLYCRRVNKPGLGMAPRDACKLLQKEGVCSEACWQYISDANKLCKGAPCKNVNEESQRHRILSYHRCFGSIKATLFSTKSPLLIVVPVYENWGNKIGADGKVPMPGGNMICYHAMIMTGWSKNYLEVKNSWGADFGDNGYLCIPEHYPVTEAWTMKKEEETNGEEKVQVRNWVIGKKNPFGVNVTFTIISTVKCQMGLYVNGRKSGFPKRIREGANEIHFNIDYGLNSETGLRLEFAEGRFSNKKVITIWKGNLKVAANITAK